MAQSSLFSETGFLIEPKCLPYCVHIINCTRHVTALCSTAFEFSQTYI